VINEGLSKILYFFFSFLFFRTFFKAFNINNTVFNNHSTFSTADPSKGLKHSLPLLTLFSKYIRLLLCGSSKIFIEHRSLAELIEQAFFFFEHFFSSGRSEHIHPLAVLREEREVERLVKAMASKVF